MALFICSCISFGVPFFMAFSNLYIPKEWKVQNELKRSFGAVEEIGRGEGSSVATLYLRGAANFGVIKIYYI